MLRCPVFGGVQMNMKFAFPEQLTFSLTKFVFGQELARAVKLASKKPASHSLGKNCVGENWSQCEGAQCDKSGSLIFFSSQSQALR